MDDLATTFRAAHLYAHRAHNITKGKTFFQDHAMFGDLYEAYAKAYDDLIERIIGLDDEKLDIAAINKKAAATLSATDGDKTPEEMVKRLLSTEEKIRSLCDEINKKATLGTQNLVAQFADDSEKRTYKLKQRVA